MPNPWDQLPEESAEAYRAFRIYMELGPSRSVDLAYSQNKGGTKGAQEGGQRGPKKGRAPGRFRGWVKKYRWVERTRAWELWMASRQIEAQAKAGEKLAEERIKRREGVDEEAWVISRQLKLRGLQMLGWPLIEETKVGANDKTIIQIPSRWALRDAVQILRLGDDLSRLSVGLSPGTTSRVAAIPEKTAESGVNLLPARLAAKFREVAAAEALALMGMEGCQPEET